ncbi:MAG: monovalent cation/H+ antiporter complex subunit F [Parvularculales bacterium]
MTMMITAAIALLVAMCLVLVRLFTGPTVYDRVLAVNSFGTKTVLIIAVMGFLSERLFLLDVALMYTLLNFIGTIAVLKFFRYRSFGRIQTRPLRWGADR